MIGHLRWRRAWKRRRPTPTPTPVLRAYTCDRCGGTSATTTSAEYPPAALPCPTCPSGTARLGDEWDALPATR